MQSWSAAMHSQSVFFFCCCFREFNLSGAHPKMSKQAVLERRQQQQQQDDDLGFRPSTSGGRGRSQSAGRQRAAGEQRLEQLARPKIAHWDKCKYVCVSPLTPVCCPSSPVRACACVPLLYVPVLLPAAVHPDVPACYICTVACVSALAWQ